MAVLGLATDRPNTHEIKTRRLPMLRLRYHRRSTRRRSPLLGSRRTRTGRSDALKVNLWTGTYETLPYPMSKRLFISSQRETAALHRTNPTVAEDVPQPTPESYLPGDQIQIYLNPADSDATSTTLSARSSAYSKTISKRKRFQQT